MKKLVYAIVLMFASVSLQAQNTAERILGSEERLSIGGYGQIDYNQKIDGDKRFNGNMDIHRLVLMFGYKFNERTRFITELEFEHVSEVYVEQAFLDYQIKDGLNFRGGLLLIPMGIINEYHEPATYNGVERPNLDNNIIPSTWREIGAGFTGRIQSANLKYQLYLVNGFLSYNGGGILRGSDAFRKGRQKGAESIFSHPNFSGKIEYSGIPSLKLGLSAYSGKTQSSMYNGIDKSNSAQLAKADSSVVGLNMIGLDARFQKKGWELRGQFTYASVSNTDEYNKLTKKDLGSAMMGYYAEVGYNLLHSKQNTEQKLVPFARFEQYNTHYQVEKITQNELFNRTEVTAGLGWWVANGAVLKADMQWLGNKLADKPVKQLNLGIGIWF